MSTFDWEDPADPSVHEPPELEPQQRCSTTQKCNAEAVYDTLCSGPRSLTVKCRLCGSVVLHNWG